MKKKMSRLKIMEELILLRDKLDEAFNLEEGLFRDDPAAQVADRIQDLIWKIGEDIGEF
jgi:hypothetical protein